MEDIIEIKRREKAALIEALLLIAKSYDPATYYVKSYDAVICPDLHRVAKLAVEGKFSEPEVAIISTLHKKNLLEKYVQEVKADEKLKEIKPDVIDAVLNASANAKKQAAVASSSAVVAYPAQTSRTPFRLFDPKKDKVALGVAVGVGVLGVGGLVTAFTMIGLATTAISTSTAAMTAVATAAVASTAFPPLAIAFLVSLGVGLAITGIILAAIAIQHHRDMKQMAFGAAAFNSMATGRPSF